MAVAIRLSRQGSKKRPFYRIVAAEKSAPRDGRFIELLGTYDPRTKSVQLKEDRYRHWLTSGALPSETVASLFRRQLREAAAEAEAAAAPVKSARPAKPKAEAKAPEAKAPEPKAPAAEATPAEAPAADTAAQTADEPAQAAPADAE